jgi:hypothetical protein
LNEQVRHANFGRILRLFVDVEIFQRGKNFFGIMIQIISIISRLFIYLTEYMDYNIRQEISETYRDDLSYMISSLL